MTILPLLAVSLTLTGPFGDRFDALVKNHVVAKDAVYLADCFKDKTEDEFWQTEFWGKYMHGAAPIAALTQCPLLRSKIDASVKAVIDSQQPDGYIGNYCPEKRYAKKTWDVWGTKYVMMGLLHAYDLTGDQATLESCKKACDYLISKVGPGNKPTIAGTGEYAGMPSCSVLEPVVWLYNRTHEQKYLDFASFIVKEMTERPDGPRLVDLANVPVADRSPLPKGARSIWHTSSTNRGKAYEMMSCYQGLLEYYEVTGRKDLLEATITTVKHIIDEEINLAGGGAADEHWYHGALHQYLPINHAQETCVTITWMRLCEKLLKLTNDPQYADQLERTFYNAYLASINRESTAFAAYTPLSGARSKGNIHCRMHTNCCNENGPRGYLSFLNAFLGQKDETVYLNFFGTAREWADLPKAGTVGLEMYTLYPKDGEIEIRLRLDQPKTFTLALRIPGWAEGSKLTLNGQSVAGAEKGGQYLKLTREWKAGDKLLLNLAMRVKLHRLDDYVAFTYGPILLARDTRFGDGELAEPIDPVWMPLENFPERFAPVRTPSNDIFMAFEANLNLGYHSENPEQKKPQPIRFCDYMSAANLWEPGNDCRTWFPVMHFPVEFILKEQ